MGFIFVAWRLMKRLIYRTGGFKKSVSFKKAELIGADIYIT